MSRINVNTITAQAVDRTLLKGKRVKLPDSCKELRITNGIYIFSCRKCSKNAYESFVIELNKVTIIAGLL